MHKFFLQYQGCFLFLLISVITHGQNNHPENGSIPDTVHNHGLILEEVVVKASPKIVVKRDTVLFSADAFIDNSEKVVEDLLKKIPGIDVAKDGTITVNGKKVDRILIEGDDLFKKDYAILSRNLSASAIDKVQVIDNYTENILLKGLVSNDNKVINLTLKNKRKKMLFGNISAGIGTDNTKDLSANLISFMNKTKIYCLGNYNTIGREPVPGIAEQNIVDVMNNNSVSNAENISPVNIYHSYKVEIDPEKINSNNARLFSTCIVHSPCPNLTVRFSGWSFLDNTTFTQIDDYLYRPGDSPISINEYSSYNKKPVNSTGNVDISYNCTKKSELKLSSTLTSAAALTTADILSNGSLYYNKLKENSLSLNSILSYTQRINNTNALVIEASFIRHREDQNLSIEQYPSRIFPFTNLFPDFLGQLVACPYHTLSLVCHYISVKRSWRMNIDMGTSFRNQHLCSSIDTSAFVKQTPVIPDSFFNRAQLRRYASTISFTLSRQIKNVQFITSLAGNFLYNCFIASINRSGELRYSSWYPSANVGIRWKRNDQTISVSYSCDTKFPEITDLYGGYLFTDYRNLQKGVGLFCRRLVYAASLGYTYSNLPKQILFYLTASHITINGVPENNLQLTENYNILSLLPNTSAINYFLCSSGIDKFISILNGGIKLKTSISFNKYRDALNSDENRQIKSVGSTTQLSFRSAFQGFFNYNIGIILNCSRSTVAKEEALYQSYIITNFLDLHFRFSDKLHAAITSERYRFNATNSSRSSYYFIDLSLKYEMVRNKLGFALIGRNLSNNKRYIYTKITDYAVQTQQYNLIPLYLLLQLNYHFR